VKPEINNKSGIGIHPQLSRNKLPMDGALVGYFNNSRQLKTSN
jgi:hypothetical protein